MLFRLISLSLTLTKLGDSFLGITLPFLGDVNDHWAEDPTLTAKALLER